MTSAVVRIKPRATPTPCDVDILARVTQAAFGQRRKMLRNTLAGYGDAIDWDAAGVSPTQRAEELSVETFVALANQVS